MRSPYKKYFLSAAIAFFVTLGSLHAYSAHNTASVVFLLARQMGNIPQDNIKEKNKKIVQEIIQYFQQHGDIDPQLLQNLYLWLDLKPDDFEGDPSTIIQKILQKINAQPNISFNKETNSYHSLGSKNMSSYTQTKNEYYITLDPQEKDLDQSIQAQINNMTSQLNEEEESFQYVELRQILENNYMLPQNLQEKLLTTFKELVKIRQQIRILHKQKRNARSSKIKKEIREEIENKKQEKQALFKQLKKICLKCNLDYDNIKYLLTNSEEVRIDLTTETLQTAVETVSTKKIVPHGEFLLLHIDHKEDSIEENPIHDHIINKPPATNTTITDPYENEQIVLKDYQKQQKIFSNLVQYIKVNKDPETGHNIYIVYYQVYNKKKDRYDYYKYTPKGFKRVREKTFFEQSKSKDVYFLVYQKVHTAPFLYPTPWINNKTLEQLQNICVGAIAAFIIVATMQIDEKPNVIYIKTPKQKKQNQNQSREPVNKVRDNKKRISGEENNGGLKNIGNSCYLNSVFQSLHHVWPKYYTKIDKPDIKKAVETMSNSMERGKKGGEGTNEEEIYAVRNAIAKYKDEVQNPYWKGTQPGQGNFNQEDPSEALFRIHSMLARKSEFDFNATLLPNDFSKKMIIKGTLGLKLKGQDLTFSTAELQGDIIVKLDFPENDNKSISLKDMIAYYNQDEKLAGNDRLKKEWKVVLQEFNINDNNQKEWMPSKELMDYLILNEYEQTKLKLDNTSHYKSVIDNVTNTTNDTKDYYELSLSNHKDKDNDERKASLQNQIKKHTKTIKYLNSCKKLSDVLEILVDENISTEERDTLFKTIRDNTINSKPTSPIRSILEKGQNLYQIMKTRSLLDKKSPTKITNTMLVEAKKFFTDKGFDKNDVDKKFRENDIRIDINSKNIPEMMIYHEGTKTESIELNSSEKGVIVLQLNRFKRKREEEYSEDTTKKINTKVTDIMQLNLEASMVNDNKSTSLPLVAAIIHSGGDSPSSGHYRALILDNGQWWLYNDASATRKNIEEVKQILIGDGETENAYMLFYKKSAPTTSLLLLLTSAYYKAQNKPTSFSISTFYTLLPLLLESTSSISDKKMNNYMYI